MKIGVLGAGNMGRAIILGLLNSKQYNKSDFKIVTATNSSVQNYQQENFLASSNWEFLAECQLIILALLPSDIKKLQDKLAATFANKQYIIISVAAGVSLKQLRKIFLNSAVTRVMPNTACENNQSMTMITKEGNKEANEQALKIFNLLGKAVLLNENKIHVFIAICGSASAYLYYWMQPLMQLALANDVSLEDSRAIIAQLLIGGGSNIERSTLSLSDLEKQVSVPNGTTVEALKIFDQHQLKDIIAQAIAAVEKRSQELE